MSNLNKVIIENFNKLIKQTEEECFQLKEAGNKKDANVCSFKVRNYKKALDVIKSLSQEIKLADQLKGIPSIGKGTLARISEILETGKLAELKTSSSTKKSSKLDEINKLQLITGIGPKGAHKLYDNKYTLDKLLNELHQATEGNDPRDISIEQIIEKAEEMDLYIKDMTHHQLVGLKYFHDIVERIPRTEMIKIETKLKKYIEKIDADLVITICGSYRRGKDTSGDIDILITHPNLETQEDIDKDGENYLINIIKKLSKSGLLVDHLTALGTTKYMGVCRLSKKHKGRRIDIRFVARDDYAPALLYFTGSKTFNQKMRAEALKKGYTINEYGIYKLEQKNGNFIHKKGKKIVVKSEKDIFDLIGMEYLKPEDRD
jgi:DNA polymerase/3'-5' exonuclease PolX